MKNERYLRWRDAQRFQRQHIPCGGPLCPTNSVISWAWRGIPLNPCRKSLHNRAMFTSVALTATLFMQQTFLCHYRRPHHASQTSSSSQSRPPDHRRFVVVILCCFWSSPSGYLGGCIFLRMGMPFFTSANVSFARWEISSLDIRQNTKLGHLGE